MVYILFDKLDRPPRDRWIPTTNERTLSPDQDHNRLSVSEETVWQTGLGPLQDEAQNVSTLGFAAKGDTGRNTSYPGRTVNKVNKVASETATARSRDCMTRSLTTQITVPVHPPRPAIHSPWSAFHDSDPPSIHCPTNRETKDTVKVQTDERSSRDLAISSRRHRHRCHRHQSPHNRAEPRPMRIPHDSRAAALARDDKRPSVLRDELRRDCRLRQCRSRIHRLLPDLAVSDRDPRGVTRHAIDDDEEQCGPRREDRSVRRHLRDVEDRRAVIVRGERRFQLDVALAHVHGMRREAGADDDGFGLVDVECVVEHVGERQRDVEVVAAVWRGKRWGWCGSVRPINLHDRVVGMPEGLGLARSA
jgi:hypothetical protein